MLKFLVSTQIKNLECHVGITKVQHLRQGGRGVVAVLSALAFMGQD